MKRINNNSFIQDYRDHFNLSTIISDDLMGSMELLEYAPGEIIYDVEEEPEYFFILVEGRLKISLQLVHGKSILLRLYHPPSILGDLEFVENRTVKTHVEAMTQARLIGIKMNRLRQATHDDPRFLRYLLSHLGKKLHDLTVITAIHRTSPLEKRLAHYLVLMEHSDNDRGNKELIPSNLTELAELLGVSYRHLHRTVTKLVEADIIENHHGALTIRDMKRLREILSIEHQNT